MVRNSELPQVGRASKQIAREVRQLIDQKGISQNEIASIIDRAQSYVSLRIKGMKSWTIDELDSLAPALGYQDFFALMRAIRIRIYGDTDSTDAAASLLEARRQLDDATQQVRNAIEVVKSATRQKPSQHEETEEEIAHRLLSGDYQLVALRDPNKHRESHGEQY